MKNEQPSHYQNQITVNVSARELYAAITRRISEWWSADFEGRAEEKGDEFTVRFGAVFKTMTITEIDPFLRVVWTCTDQHMQAPPGIEAISNTKEWVGTKIFWMIDSHSEEETILKLFHMGLHPQVECWAICETGWDQTLKSLLALLTNGTGYPFQELDEEHMNRARQTQQNGSD